MPLVSQLGQGQGYTALALGSGDSDWQFPLGGRGSILRLGWPGAGGAGWVFRWFSYLEE